MAKFKYVGPLGLGEEIPAAGVAAKRGETVEIDDELAEGLDANPNWERVDKKRAESVKQEDNDEHGA